MHIEHNNFWGSNFYEHPPLTDEMVREAESRLGLSLPSELIELLRVQNGGYTLGFMHPMPVPTSLMGDEIPVDSIGGIVLDPEHKTAFGLLDSEYLMKEWDLPEKQVLLTGEGHFWISLDYRNGPVPSVTWLDVVNDEDIRIAPTFPDFLAGLVPSEAGNAA